MKGLASAEKENIERYIKEGKTYNKKNTPLIYDFFYKNATFFLKRKKETIEFSLNNTEVSN